MDKTNKKGIKNSISPSADELKVSNEDLQATNKKLQQQVDELVKVNKALRESEERTRQAMVKERENDALKSSPASVEDTRLNESLQTIQERPWLNLALRYSAAILVVIIAFWLYEGMTAWLGPGLPTYILFYPAIIIVAFLLGFGPGLLATFIAVMIAVIWIIPPIGQFAIDSPVERFGVVIFSSMGVLLSSVAELYRRNRIKAAAYDKETALRETRQEKEFLANILEHASQPFAVGYLDGRLGRFNHAFEQLTGYTVEELHTIDWSATLTPREWRDMETQKLDELRRTGQPVRYEKEYIRKDGSRVPIELLVHMVSDEKGNPEYYYSFITNITERKRAEEALRESKERLDLAQKVSNVGIFEWNIQTGVNTWTPELEAIYGLQEGEFPGTQEAWEELVHPEDMQEAVRGVDIALETGEPGEGEWRVIWPDGSIRWLLGRWQVFSDDVGKPLKLIGVNVDITEHKNAEEQIRILLEKTQQLNEELEVSNEELQATTEELHVSNEELREQGDELLKINRSLSESEERFRNLADNIPNLAWMADADGWIFWYNKQWYDYTGTTLEEMQGWGWQKVHHPDYVESVTEEWSTSIKEGKPYDNVFPLKGKDGNYRWFLTRVTPIKDNQGKIQRWFGTNTDITVRKKLEEELRESRDNLEDKVKERTVEIEEAYSLVKENEFKLKEVITELERSNRELESFAYITSHDLQEPLRSIASYAQLIERRYKGQLDDDADEFIDFMVIGAKRMKDMIQGLLEYSRVGTQGEEFKDFSAEDALNNALSNLKSSIEECDVEVTHDSLPVVFGDETQIISVFQNLIGNAIKFKKPDEPPRIHISARKEGNEHIFSVQDNGIGMEEQYSDRIFEVFKRLHPIGEYQGTGIGLAIVKRIVERHGGRVWLESSLGEGSTFYFTIPLLEVKSSF